jgi:hypothetical protein
MFFARVFFFEFVVVCSSENECIGVSTWNLGTIESCVCVRVFFFPLCVQSYALQHIL